MFPIHWHFHMCFIGNYDDNTCSRYCYGNVLGHRRRKNSCDTLNECRTHTENINTLKQKLFMILQVVTFLMKE